MIQPTKTMDLDTCVINAAARILAELRASGPAKYDQLLSNLLRDMKPNVRFQFPYGLSLLYLLGLITYHAESDTIALARPVQQGVAT